MKYLLILSLSTLLYCITHAIPTKAPLLQPIEIPFEISHDADNPYTEVEGHVQFTHSGGEVIQRPLFWDGGDRFSVRFTSTEAQGTWQWELIMSHRWQPLSVVEGELQATSSNADNVFTRHGFWNIPKNSRQMYHWDGRSVLIVADTGWAIPWRATTDEVRKYAKDRQDKGFNATLLMTVQPDMGAVGPEERGVDEGFMVGFRDLPEGHLNEINISYFQYLDQIIDILIEHEIVPVFQPVFHGFGWKGLETLGNTADPVEYARFCKYLVARYGASPAVWLIGGDGDGDAPGIPTGGEVVEYWDYYQHPTGLHYAPHGKTDSHQAADWLDFQWSQTGHNGTHLPEASMALYYQTPIKAAANGEPTYENMGSPGKASGWWQGHEAWSNLTAGGTMGVVYGAGSLWNWAVRPNEPGLSDWTVAKDAAWYDALEFEGATYVGNLGKILNKYDMTGVEPRWNIAPSRRGLYVKDELFILYMDNQDTPWFKYSQLLPKNYRIYDPKTAELIDEGKLADDQSEFFRLKAPKDAPTIFVFYSENRLYKDS